MVFVLNVGFTEMGEVRQTTDLNVIISYGLDMIGMSVVRCDVMSGISISRDRGSVCRIERRKSSL